jgi:dTMP kinase
MRTLFDMRSRTSIESDMTCPIPGGFLVAIEGIDGSGKTTQAQLLAKFCSENRLSFVISKEPTKGRYGRQIRDSAIRGRMSVEDEVDALLKDRAEHVENVIAPALKEEKIVILDRYYFSTAAYQGAHGADADAILAANECFAPEPDLLIVLDVSPETGIDRIRKRGDEPNKFESLESLEKARMIFKHITRPYKREINAEAGIEWVSFWVGKFFQAAAANKIAHCDFSVNGLRRTIEFFGGTAEPLSVIA